jgi:hypothetical protein
MQTTRKLGFRIKASLINDAENSSVETGLARLGRRGKPRLYGKLLRRLFLQRRRHELVRLDRQRLPGLA